MQYAETVIYFNTSYVVIKLLQETLITDCMDYFNTSYVVIKLVWT